jgi:hypothetical protein
LSKRVELDRLPIDAGGLHKVVRQLFSKANDYGPFAGEQLVGELNRLGIVSRKQARLLLKKHRRVLIQIDRQPVDAVNERIYSEEPGGNDFIRKWKGMKVWYAYPALVRLALELEFGEEYEKFANERDYSAEGKPG